MVYLEPPRHPIAATPRPNPYKRQRRAPTPTSGNAAPQPLQAATPRRMPHEDPEFQFRPDGEFNVHAVR